MDKLMGKNIGNPKTFPLRPSQKKVHAKASPLSLNVHTQVALLFPLFGMTHLGNTQKIRIIKVSSSH